MSGGINCCIFTSTLTLKADFRLKCAPLFSFPSLFLFLPLLRYLLPIGLTLAHCSLAFCQSQFLSPFPPFFFSFSCAVMQFPLFTLLTLSLHLIPPCLCVNSAKDSSGISSLFITQAIFLLLQFLPFLSLISLHLSPFFLFSENVFFLIRNESRL